MRRRLFSIMVLLTTLVLLFVTVPELVVSRPARVETGSLPQIAPPPGQYDKDIRITLTTPDTGSQIIYTLDGSLPLPGHSHAFNSPIPLTATPSQMFSIRYRLLYDDGRLGAVQTATYFLRDGRVAVTIPVISISIPPEDLYGEEGLLSNFDARGPAWEHPVHLTYFSPDSSRPEFVINAGLRIHGNASRFDPKKSFRLYFRSEYGQPYLDYPLFAGSSTSRYKRLILHAGGQDTIFQATNWTLLRDALAYELGHTIIPDAVPFSRPVLVFVNGEMHGVYLLSERIDDWFFSTRHGLDDVDFLDTPELSYRVTDNPEARLHWDHLLDFVETHDLADPRHYAFVSTQMDIAQYIDYHVFQVYYANRDWPHNNVLQFRPRVQGGRWRWLLWDLQYGFGHARHSPVDLDMVGRILRQKHPNMTGRAAMLLHKLLENPQFRRQFLTRMADLLNTKLAPDPVIAQLDQLAAQVEPVIAYEIARWSARGGEAWLTHIEEMRAFARERPSYVREHITQHFPVSRHQLNLTLPPPEVGLILLNGIPLQTKDAATWQGEFFTGNEVNLVAIPVTGTTFSGWGAPESSANRLSLTIEEDHNLSPLFSAAATTDAPQPGDVTIRYADGEILLQVNDPDGVDLRGWQLSDADSPTTSEESSLIFKDVDFWHQVSAGTTIVIKMNGTEVGDEANDLHDQIAITMSSQHLELPRGVRMILGDVDNLVLLDDTGKVIDLITIGGEEWYWQLAAAFAYLPNQYRQAPLP